MTGWFLGVDGGGTKTAFVVIGDDGVERARHEATSSYHLQIGIEGLRAVLADGIAAVLAKAVLTPADLSYAFFGLPAHGEDSRIQGDLDAIPASLLGHKRYRCGNDMVCGWAGSLACADGINIVAGTGSIGYGERAGFSARAGGWGEVFGDEGSAYWIAVQGLNAFSRMADGRLAKGPLYDLMRAEFALAHDLDLSGLLTGGAAGDRDRIAATSRLVAAAAAQDDAIAAAIFQSAAHELAAIVGAVADALEFDEGAAVPVSYSGGVFKAGPLILAPFAETLRHRSARFVLVEPQHEPVIGAALYALKLWDRG